MAAEDGFWLSTYTGRRVYPLRLHPDQFSITDIAMGLSNIARFSGQSAGLLSVAEHCVRGAAHASTPALAREFLLHDAAEAYLGDMVKPAVEILDEYRELRDRMQRCIAEKFALPWPMTPECKAIDERMLVTEAPVVFAHRDTWWEQPPFPSPYDGEWITLADRPRVGDDRPDQPFVRPLDYQFWPPRMARRRFLDEYHKLQGKQDDAERG